jgi:hypothetical protein
MYRRHLDAGSVNNGVFYSRSGIKWWQNMKNAKNIPVRE